MKLARDFRPLSLAPKEGSQVGILHPSSFILFSLKVGAIVLILLAGLVIASFPVKSYTQTADTQPTVDEKLYFGSPESHPAGYRFDWTLPGAALVYTHVPRYTPLNLRLKLNLQR